MSISNQYLTVGGRRFAMRCCNCPAMSWTKPQLTWGQPKPVIAMDPEAIKCRFVQVAASL